MGKIIGIDLGTTPEAKAGVMPLIASVATINNIFNHLCILPAKIMQTERNTK